MNAMRIVCFFVKVLMEYLPSTEAGQKIFSLAEFAEGTGRSKSLFYVSAVHWIPDYDRHND